MFVKEQEMAYKITITGYFGFSNAGDELILESLLEGAGKRFPGLSAVVLGGKQLSVKKHKFARAVNRRNLYGAAKALLTSRMLVFGGGGVLQDLTSTRSLLYYLSLIVFAKIAGKKVVLLAQGIGPINSPVNRKLAGRVLGLADFVAVRDRESAETLAGLKVDGRKSAITADLVYSLETKKTAAVTRSPGGKPFLGVSLREQRGVCGFEEKIASMLKILSGKYGFGIGIIPFNTKEDAAVSARVAEMTGCSELYFWDSTGGLTEYFQRFDLVLGMRLHALIVSCLLGIPFAAISPGGNGDKPADGKIGSFISSMGLDAAEAEIKAGTLAAGDCAEAVYKIYERRKEASALTRARVEKLAGLSRNNFEYLEMMMEGKRK